MNQSLSNIFVVLYVVVTLFVRFILEPQLQGRYFLSIGLGAFSLLFLWAMIKSGFIRPSLMGLHKFGSPPQDKIK